MGDPQVTIVVVPRERFSLIPRSLETLYEHTTVPFQLIYVAAGAPPSMQPYLETAAGQKGFTLLQTDRFLAPNQARNLGLRQVKTKYVVFLDNDSLVAPGWLEALVRCAEETGAWVVGPLYLIGEFHQQTIHMAGGSVHVQEQDGQRLFYDEYALVNVLVPDAGDLRRRSCDFVEYHCLLARTDMLDGLGPLDEQVLSLHEHIDFCMTVRQAGGTVYFEPASVTTHIPPPTGDWRDLPYFMVRWSEAWNRSSIAHFKSKWGFTAARSYDDRANPDGEEAILNWGRGHRRLMSGVRIPPAGDRPEMALEEARCMAALFFSVDRDAFDLVLETEDEEVIEEATALDPLGVMERLPSWLAQADQQNANLLLRPVPPASAQQPALLCVHAAEPHRLNRLRPLAFLIMETSPQEYQCWLAVSRSDPRSAALWRRLAGSVRGSRPQTVPLAGSRNRSAGQRVRLVEGQAGLLHPGWKLEEQGLLQELRQCQLS